MLEMPEFNNAGDRETRWQQAPMPMGGFPFGAEMGLRLGEPWKWFVQALEDSDAPTLFAFDSRKEEYRIWQSTRTDGEDHLALRIEHHGIAPGWHVHAGHRGESVLTTARRPVSDDLLASVTTPGLWREAPMDRLRNLFPSTLITDDVLTELREALNEVDDAAALRQVPFGAALRLTGEDVLGDVPGLYISQLGQRTPSFRLEDDGTTLPLLQALGILPGGNRLRPASLLGEHTGASLLFGPDLRTLFTPYFPMNELADRTRGFIAALRALSSYLPAPAAHSARERADDTPSSAPAHGPAKLRLAAG